MASKFDMMMDLNGLIEEMAENDTTEKREFVEVPHGQYEVKIDKAELRESKSGKPMVTMWYTILEGEFKGQKIFYNQVVERGFQLGIVYKMIREFIGDCKFTSFTQLEEDLDLLIDKEFALDYLEGKNGFSNYKVVEVF